MHLVRTCGGVRAWDGGDRRGSTERLRLRPHRSSRCKQGTEMWKSAVVPVPMHLGKGIAGWWGKAGQ
jgi:hypothetical protein